MLDKIDNHEFNAVQRKIMMVQIQKPLRRCMYARKIMRVIVIFGIKSRYLGVDTMFLNDTSYPDSDFNSNCDHLWARSQDCQTEI